MLENMWENAINNTRAVFAVSRKELKEALSPVNPSQLNMAIEDAINNINETEMVVIMALKTQIPKKPYEEYGAWHCKVCGQSLLLGEDNYCPSCGQAIDWSE